MKKRKPTAGERMIEGARQALAFAKGSQNYGCEVHVLLRALREHVGGKSRPPWDVYRELDPGSGGHALAPSTETRRGVKQAIQKKLHRDDRR